MKDLYVHFNKMAWPLNAERIGEIEWQLRYGDPSSVRLQAASIVSAYHALLFSSTSERREEVVKRAKDSQ